MKLKTTIKHNFYYNLLKYKHKKLKTNFELLLNL